MVLFETVHKQHIKPLLSSLQLFRWSSNCHSNHWSITPLVSSLKIEITNGHRGFFDYEPKKYLAITTHLSTNLGYDVNQDSNYLLSRGPRYVDDL